MLPSNKIATVTIALMLCATSSAFAKGCLTGAAVGGVAGHVAGSHAVIGAGVGCVIGRHRANKKDKEQATARDAAVTPAASSTSTAPAVAPRK